MKNINLPFTNCQLLSIFGFFLFHNLVTLVGINDHPDPLWRMGEVSFGGVLRQVSLACLPEARIGDRLMVHVGLALAVLDGEPADGLDGELPP